MCKIKSPFKLSLLEQANVYAILTLVINLYVHNPLRSRDISSDYPAGRA